jgi:hypothetical protein
VIIFTPSCAVIRNEAWANHSINILPLLPF